MVSPLHEDHAASPPDLDAVDALIRQARRLRGQVDAVRGGSAAGDGPQDSRSRWQRALCDLAVRQLDTLGEHLGQLREQAPADPHDAVAEAAEGTAYPRIPSARATAVRAGRAEWNLLTDEVEWSGELYRIFGRTRQDGPLTLDELPSWLFTDDQRALTEMVTGCLVDGRPINGEFRIVRPDGSVRTVHMNGEPVPAADGGTGSLWAVLRDVSELRRDQQEVRETRESLEHEWRAVRAEHRLARELQDAMRPAARRPAPLAAGGAPPALDLAARHLAAADGALGGGWYDATRLPDDAMTLTVGDLTGRGTAAATQRAMLLGAVRALALTGADPGTVLDRLNLLLDQGLEPALGGAVCARWTPGERTVAWARAGHPAPLLFRAGAGRALDGPQGVPLGAAPDTGYPCRTERLAAGDVLVLHTEALVPRGPLDVADDDPGRTAPLLALAPRFAGAPDARACVRVIAEGLGVPERTVDACVLVARVR